MRVIGDKNQISEDVFDFMISFLPFPQKSIHSELAKLFSTTYINLGIAYKTEWSKHHRCFYSIQSLVYAMPRTPVSEILGKHIDRCTFRQDRAEIMLKTSL